MEWALDFVVGSLSARLCQMSTGKDGTGETGRLLLSFNFAWERTSDLRLELPSVFFGELSLALALLTLALLGEACGFRGASITSSSLSRG